LENIISAQPTFRSQNRLFTRPCHAARPGSPPPAASRPCLGTLLSRLALPVALLVPVGASADSLTAFGNGKIAVPSDVPVGTVVARDYFTPRELCGMATCDVTHTIFYPKGSLTGMSSGPDIETRVAGLSTRILLDGKPAVSTTSTTVVNSLEVQLFRDARNPKDGSLKPSIFNMYYIVGYKSGLLGDSTSIYLAAQTAFIAGTCKVPSQTVTLPDVGASEFSGVGSKVRPTLFTLKLNDCPAGFNRIGFQVSPINGEMAGVPGALTLRSDSTAKGITIGLFDPVQNTPLTLNRSHPTPYSGHAGSYSIALSAAYLQTEQVIRGGTVKAGAYVLLDYQ
jgi:major type 1 subunit fimbrin (pilin)